MPRRHVAMALPVCLPAVHIPVRVDRGILEPIARQVMMVHKTGWHCHNANFVVTGGVGGCRYDNLRCHQ